MRFAAIASSQCSGKPFPIVQTRAPQAKPGSCFACNKLGHWRAQCPYTAKSTTGQWLATSDPEHFQGVVNSIVSNNSSDISDDLSNSDHPHKAIEIRSLLNYEFPSVCGCLSLCYDQWVKLGASGFILSIVPDDYKIPWVTLPPPKVCHNNLSAVTHSHFVLEAISDLLRIKRVKILDHKPSSKKRLMLDSRHVNLYVFKCKFRCEDVSVALQTFSRGFFSFNFDLKSGYHHVEIFTHRCSLAVLLGFWWWCCEVFSVHSFTFQVVFHTVFVQKQILFYSILLFRNKTYSYFMQVQRNSHGYFSRWPPRGWYQLYQGQNQQFYSSHWFD